MLFAHITKAMLQNIRDNFETQWHFVEKEITTIAVCFDQPNIGNMLCLVVEAYSMILDSDTWFWSWRPT